MQRPPFLSMPDFDAFRNRLSRNTRHWSRWARRQSIACYRIYDRDIPQFPLALDRYGPHLHLQEYDTGWRQTDTLCAWHGVTCGGRN